MPGFFHFLPEAELDEILDRKTLRRSLIVERGLGNPLADCYRVPDDVMVTAVTNFGDDAVRGVCLYPKPPAGDDPRHWGYHAATQTWKQITEDRWLGWETERPPEPDSLQRRRVVGGVLVTGRGDLMWRCPIARSPRGGDTLPGDYRLEDGRVTKAVAPEYDRLWSLSGEVRDYYHGLLEPDDEQLFKYRAAAEILGHNYRIGPEEINVLQELGRAPITTDTIDAILVNFIDFDLPQSLLEAIDAKKNAGSSAAA